MSRSAPDVFARRYAEARERFLAAAEAAGLDVHAHSHPMLGRDGEALAMDVVRDGPEEAERLLVISSGCHGVEGYCGSGVQVALLGDVAFREAARAAGVAVLHVHALNPYGFSWLRRATHENVDLNRNFQDFDGPLPDNPGYAEVHALLLPPQWPPPPEVEARLQQLGAEWGLRRLQQAITGGQHSHPEGLFYGGLNPTWSQVKLRQTLREHGRHCRRLAWIDIHTGLGPEGVGERIFAARDDAAAWARAQAWWGEGTTSLYADSSSATALTGMLWAAAYDECPQAEYTGIALEFGTRPVMATLAALRAEHWLQNHPEAPAEQAAAIRQHMFETFFIDTPAWKQAVLEQSRDAAVAAVEGLAGRR